MIMKQICLVPSRLDISKGWGRLRNVLAPYFGEKTEKSKWNFDKLKCWKNWSDSHRDSK